VPAAADRILQATTEGFSLHARFVIALLLVLAVGCDGESSRIELGH
jgi:hypothetical protein